MDQAKQETEKTVIGPDGKPLPAKGLILGIEKFQYPDKHFRLIWVQGSRAWFAEEDTSRYRKKYGDGSVIEAGRRLLAAKGASFFSEITR